MKDLIEALQIFAKYNPDARTNCMHDTLQVCYVDAENMSKEDLDRLDELGFHLEDEKEALSDYACFYSFRWGSC